MKSYEFNYIGRRTVSDDIISFLFTDLSAGYTKAVDGILERNFEVEENASFKIAFQGKVYIHSDQTKYSTLICDLHEDLQSEMYTLSKIILDSHHRKLRTSAYLGRLLRKVRTVGDMFLLLPETVHKAVPKAELDVQMSGTTLSRGDVQEFLSLNKKDSDAIEMQMAINLVTRM